MAEDLLPEREKETVGLLNPKIQPPGLPILGSPQKVKESRYIEREEDRSASSLVFIRKTTSGECLWMCHLRPLRPAPLQFHDKIFNVLGKVEGYQDIGKK